MISESTLSRSAALAGRLSFLNAGSVLPNALVQIYEGTRPANANTLPSSQLLVAIPLSNPAGSVSGGVLTLSPLEPGLIMNSGIATWARVLNREGNVAFDMDAGAAGSGAECILTQTTLFAGGLVAITSAVLG